MAKILLIDDDGIVRDALSVFLTRDGHTVSAAADGGSGVQAFKRLRPDLVILDRDMPVKTGSVVLREVRELDKNVPVLILTGFDAPEDAENYLRDGATAFISKADGLSKALGAVDRLLGGRKTSPAAHAAPAPRSAKPLLLAADDDPAMLNVLGRFLASQGYEVVTAPDGAEAVSLARGRKPDLVLLDILMPKKDGMEVLRELVREMPRTGFLMITGNEDEEVAKACLELGAFDYVQKPVNLELLGNIIKARLLLQRGGR